MISVRIGGAAVRIHFSFFVFNALIFLMRSSSLILSFYGVCLLHEAGHLAALKLTGGRISSVDISGAGAVIDTRKGGIATAKNRLIVLLAGPAANIFVFLILNLLGCHGKFPHLSLIAAVYNMLPYHSLDGGAIIALFSVGTAYERSVNSILTALKLLIIAVSAAAAYHLGREAFPLFAASLALFTGDTADRR